MQKSRDDAANNPLHPFSGLARGAQREMSSHHHLASTQGKWYQVGSLHSIIASECCELALHYFSLAEKHDSSGSCSYTPHTQGQQSGVNWCPTFVRKIISEGSCLNLHPISLYQASMIHCFTFPRVVVSRAQSEAEST